MNRRYGGMKEQVGRVSRHNTLIHKLHGSCMLQPKEKLPPRLNLRGISLAARVVSHEIRDFTKKTTGKDLVDLQDSKIRNDTLRKLSELKLAIGSSDVKENLLTLAINHSANFTKSLSPEEPILGVDYGFKKKQNSSSLVARFHEQCKRDEKVRFTEQVRRDEQLAALAKTRRFTSKPQLEKKRQCGCNENVLAKKEGCCFVSCWQHKGISEEEMNTFFTENVPYFQEPGTLQKSELQVSDQEAAEWKHFIKNNRYTVFRKQLPSGIYEYRIQATFEDISANNLFKTHIDGEYRKKWDPYVLNLDVVESDKETTSDLIHWVTKCPYPFATREYIYLRRYKIDHKNKAMILFQEATDKSNIPQDPKVMRVDTYLSKAIIKPHSEDFDKEGCDYLLSYYDDPRMRLPNRMIDIAASKGITDSMDKLQKAALGLAPPSANVDVVKSSYFW